MSIAREGIREILLATLILGVLAAGALWLFWPLVVIPLILWGWVLSFFRDPVRQRDFAPGELCAPADGTVTEVTPLDHYEPLGGPAIRIGIFLSLFNVHANRAPCAGKVRTSTYKKGEFLDARHEESGQRNESNTILLDPDAPLPGPVEVRQVAGLVARRIVCHAGVGDGLSMGERFGFIKFGSRTELIIPHLAGTEVTVVVGDPVRAGLTLLARQPVARVEVLDHAEPSAAEAPRPTADPVPQGKS